MDPESAQHHFVLQRFQDDGGGLSAVISTVILNSFQNPVCYAVFVFDQVVADVHYPLPFPRRILRQRSRMNGFENTYSPLCASLLRSIPRSRPFK